MFSDYLKSHFELSIDIKKTFMMNEKNLIKFDNIVGMIIQCYKNNGKTIWLGNGGSAADAQHIAAEFTSKLGRERPSLPADSFSVDPSLVTSISNDFGYENLFVRQLESKVNVNDIVIAISTSGNSKNIINALKYLKTKNITTFLFGGNGGGKSKSLVSESLIIDSNRTEFIQECHIMLGHCICYCVEEKLFFEDKND